MRLARINNCWCSAQYSEYSVNETGERINGGAVKEDKSPEYEAIDFKKLVQVEEEATELMTLSVEREFKVLLGQRYLI